MKSFLGIALLAALACSTSAFADDSHAGHDHMNMSTSAAPAMPKPGPETKALATLFEGTCNWSGTVAAGAMGPDSKATTCKGKQVGKAVGDGFWYANDIENKVGDGKDAMIWKGHVIVGYDLANKSYRAFCADNMGSVAEYRGTMESDKFVLESAAPMMMAGQMMDDRMTWELTPTGTWAFKEETRPQGGEWKTFQTATLSGPKGKLMATASAAQ